MKKIFAVATIAALLVTTGCTTRLGQFTAASTMNVRNLDYSIEEQSMAKTKGKSCLTYFLFFPIGDLNDRFEIALDNAIENGRSRGLDGDLLVNTRINHQAWTALLFGQDCIKVEGDLVSVKP